jgi:hypothetical protein
MAITPPPIICNQATAKVVYCEYINVDSEDQSLPSRHWGRLLSEERTLPESGETRAETAVRHVLEKHVAEQNLEMHFDILLFERFFIL